MTITSTETLPVLPLPDGVVLPDMVVTVAIQSKEAAEAIRAAHDGRLLLVPRVNGAFARVGVIASVADRSLDNSPPMVTLRALGRARVGAGVVGSTPGLTPFSQYHPLPGMPLSFPICTLTDSATAQSASNSLPSSVMADVVVRAQIASVRLIICPYAVRDTIITTTRAIMSNFVFMTLTSFVLMNERESISHYRWCMQTHNRIWNLLPHPYA